MESGRLACDYLVQSLEPLRLAASHVFNVSVKKQRHMYSWESGSSHGCLSIRSARLDFLTKSATSMHELMQLLRASCCVDLIMLLTPVLTRYVLSTLSLTCSRWQDVLTRVH